MRLSRLRERMEREQLGGVLISSELSASYLSGFDFSDGYLAVLADKAYLVTDFRYTEAANMNADKAFEVVEATGSLLSFALGLLLDGGARRVAYEEEAVTVSLYQKLQTITDGRAELLGIASEWLGDLRRVKSEREIACIKRAQAITDAAFSHILSVLTPKMTEREVALELEFFMRKMGAEGMAFDVIAVSGSASSLPHGVPRNKKLEKGFLTMDFGAKAEGYCSDMTRTVVLGKADAEMKRLYDTVLLAQSEALAYLKEGASCRDADGVARAIIDGAGYRGCFGHSLGHGVGRYIHEAPRLSASAKPDARLECGNVVTVEPGIYLGGKYGCRIEDMAVITADGIEDLTHSPKQLIELF